MLHAGLLSFFFHSKIPDCEMKWDVSALHHIARGSSMPSPVPKLGDLPARGKQGCGRSGQMCQTEWLPPKTACRLRNVSTWLRRDAVAFRISALRRRFSCRAHRLDTLRSFLVFQRCFWSLGSQWERARRSLLPVYGKAWKKKNADIAILVRTDGECCLLT